jgi:hypothetical protein
MKKRTKTGMVLTGLMIVFLSVVATHSTYAQSAKKAAGIKGGLNISNLYVDNVNDEDARFGFNLGLYGQLFSNDVFAIQPEINFSTKGSMVITDGIIDQKTKFNLNYIDVPVLAVFKLGKAAEIHAGPYASYLINANITSEGDLGNSARDLDRDNFQSFDYGLAGGLGLNFGALQVGARYNYGLKAIAKTNDAKNLIGDSKNSVAQLYVAFRMN